MSRSRCDRAQERLSPGARAAGRCASRSDPFAKEHSSSSAVTSREFERGRPHSSVQPLRARAVGRKSGSARSRTAPEATPSGRACEIDDELTGPRRIAGGPVLVTGAGGTARYLYRRSRRSPRPVCPGSCCCARRRSCRRSRCCFADEESTKLGRFGWFVGFPLVETRRTELREGADNVERMLRSPGPSCSSEPRRHHAIGTARELSRRRSVSTRLARPGAAEERASSTRPRRSPR